LRPDQDLISARFLIVREGGGYVRTPDPQEQLPRLNLVAQPGAYLDHAAGC